MISNILIFIASLPDNIRVGLAVLLYITAYFLLMALAIYGGRDDRT